jgi:hypothetical protein
LSRSFLILSQILNIGSSDSQSFEVHGAEYNVSAWQLYERFEDAYISLVRGIRQLAYPDHPATRQAMRSGSSGLVPATVPATIPIFVMRPLRGELEHATQGAVRRLRQDGDQEVFWLDTSGWLDPDDMSSEDRDFWYDETTAPSKWRLTERGNQRVAVYLHMHVCRYLAEDGTKCPFLSPEVYQGNAFQPNLANFD